MPTVPRVTGPEIQQRGLPGAQLSVGGVSPDAFGAVQARQIGQAGEVAQIYSQQQQKLQAQEDADQVFRAETALKTDYLAFEREELNRKGADAKGAGERSAKWWGEAEKKYTEGLVNDRQRTAFGRTFMTAQVAGNNTLLGHEDKQRQASLVDSAQARTASAIGMARADPSPDRVGGAVAEITGAVETLGRLNGWSPAVIQAERARQLELMSKALAGDAYDRSALAIENGVDPRKTPDWDVMSEGHKAILTNRLNSEEQRRQSKALAEQQRREQAAERALDQALEFSLTGAPMDGKYEDTLRGVAGMAGPEFQARAERIIGVAQHGTGFGALPLQQQQLQLRALEAQSQTQGSNPEFAQKLQFARSIHERQVAEYKENPWAAANRFGRAGTPIQEANIASADQAVRLVEQRLLQIGAVETMAGRPVSPFQPAEAASFQAKLREMDPGAQSRALADVSSRLNLGQIEALADQLGTGSRPLALAMKLGSEKTNAGRMTSELMLRGAKAIQDKTVKKDDAALTGWRAEISALVRGTLGSEAAEQEVIDAAFYVRAAQDVEGIAAPGFTRGIGSGAEDAIALVIGQPMERAGVKTLLPRGMDRGMFNNRFESAARQAAAAQAPGGKLYLRGQEVPFETGVRPHLDGYGLQRDGSGRYIPISRGAAFTVDPAGRIPFTIEVK